MGGESLLKLFYKPMDGVKDGIPEDISEYRKRKIESAVRLDVKKALIAAAEVLKAGFAFFGVKEKEVVYAFLENGKPYALSHPEIHFSLSHSENMAVAAFSDAPVGVDCEKEGRRVSKKLIERFFSEDEVRRYKEEPLLLWVAAESASKLSGEGVFSEKRTPVPSFFGERARGEGIFLTRLSFCGDLTVIASRSDETAEIIPL